MSPLEPSRSASAAGLRLEVLTSLEQLARHQEAWLELMGRSGSDQATLSPAWLLAWWQVFQGLGRRRLRAVLFWEGARLVGLAPLQHRWYVARSGVPFARVELLASGEPEAHEICSDYVGVIAARDAERPVAEALAALLARGGLGWLDELRLGALDASLEMPRLLEEELRRAGLPARLTCEHAARYIPLPESYDAYLTALPAQGRYLVRRSARDFEAWAGERARFHHVERPADLAEGLRTLIQLHGERWRGAGRDGAFASPLFRAFHEAVLPELLARGALDLRWVTVGGEPVAAAYNLVWANRVQFYQGGRALTVPKGVRPGIVLHAHAIRDAIQAGRAEYDFLAGDSQYKRQLSLAARPLGELVVERRSARRWLHRGVVDAVRRLRRHGAPAVAPQPGDF